MNANEVKINGKSVKWDVLIAAATQQDPELSAAYRAILRDLLPSVSAHQESAYREYCRVGATTRGTDSAHAIGHGSWVSGPDPDRQATWLAWRDLESRIAAACE